MATARGENGSSCDLRSARQLLALFAATAAVPAQQAYEFLVDGERDEVHFVAVEGPRGKPSPGDVAWVGGFEFVLERPGLVQLWRVGRDLYESDGDARVLVGLYVDDASRPTTLSNAQLGRLRSIEFACWEPGFAELLAKVDPARCFVRFAPPARLDDLRALPAGLRHLDLQYGAIDDLDGIERMRELRFLRAPGEPTVDSVAPIARLCELRYLELESTGVRDLTPLGGHPTLRSVLLAHTPIEKLPAAMPALTDLVAIDTGCPADEAARCRARNPRARVVTTRRELLLEAVADAAHVRLRTGCTGHPSEQDRELCTIADRGEIESLVALLRTAERYAPLRVVPGCEEHTLEFRAADGHVLLELGVFTDGMLRSFPLWGITPASVPDDARAPLRAWLEAHGAELRR